jgi:hypothetical protein
MLGDDGNQIWGSARVPRAGSGVAPEPSLDKLVCFTGFRRDAENGNRDGRAPHFRMPHLNGSFPVFILGWTIGANESSTTDGHR